MMRISSSRQVIKDWNPEVVRDFVPPLREAEQPTIRELERRVLYDPREKTETEQEEGHFSDEEGQEELTESEESLQEDEEQINLELEEAKCLAAEILENARAEAEKIKEEARQEGFSQGKEEGWQEGMAETAAELERTLEKQKQTVWHELSEALEEIGQAKKRCLQNYLDQLKDCAFAVAEKVIHTSLETSGDIIKRMIVFETEKLKKTAWLKIYIEKMDYDMMMETDADLVAELSKVSDNIKFIVMEKEQRGSCIIETPEEILDIGVETQMDNIREIAGMARM